jgi:hypothetical protein
MAENTSRLFVIQFQICMIVPYGTLPLPEIRIATETGAVTVPPAVCAKPNVWVLLAVPDCVQAAFRSGAVPIDMDALRVNATVMPQVSVASGWFLRIIP